MGIYVFFFNTNYHELTTNDEVVQLELGDAMDAVGGAVVGLRVAAADGREADAVGTTSDSDDSQGVVGKMEGFDDGGAVESADAEAVQPHFHSFEQHALYANAKVDIDIAAFGNGRAADNIGLRFLSLRRQVELGQGGAQMDVAEHSRDFVSFGDGTEAQHLLIAGGGELGVDADDAEQLLAGDGNGGVETAMAAVLLQQAVEGLTHTTDDRLPSGRRAKHFLVTFL